MVHGLDRVSVQREEENAITAHVPGRLDSRELIGKA